MSSSNSTLSALVSPTPHLLAYSVPLLLVCAPLTLAGTFLTLDRTRSFPSSYAPVPLPGAFDGPKKKRRINFALEGGIGGLASGYVFGLQLATFLSLLVPAISSSGALSPNSFLAVWILSCILTTVLGGRYRHCALLFPAITGGALSALALSLVLHPPLLPRQVLVALLSTLSPLIIFIFCLPRLSNLLRPTLRAATASSGAFSLVLAIALLAHIPAWADVWERLWLHDGESWGSSKEKGLSATFFILMCAGFATDWALNRWLGECPDEKWDNYLANYAANLPNDASRAGKFKPFVSDSPWGRLFRSPSKKDTLFPLSPPSSHKLPRSNTSKDATGFMSDDDLTQDPIKHFLDRYNSQDDLTTQPAFLKKARSPKAKKIRTHKNLASGRKQPIKFGTDLSSDSSDDDSTPKNVRPWLRQKASMVSSSPTLVDGSLASPSHEYDLNAEFTKLKKGRVKAGGNRDTPDYSDYEEDLGSPRTRAGPRKEDEAGWSPGFMKRHTSSSANGSGSGSGVTTANESRNGIGAMPMGAVPATPSLIKALDRITAAQKDAFGPGSISPPHMASRATALPKGRLEGLPETDNLDSDDDDELERQEKTQRAPRWEEFWRDVKRKAET